MWPPGASESPFKSGLGLGGLPGPGPTLDAADPAVIITSTPAESEPGLGFSVDTAPGGPLRSVAH